MNLAATLRGTTYRFADVKDVLAKANEEKSGDRLAGVAAASVSERIAAKRVLAELTLQELHENPVVPAERDAVTRLILDDLQRPVYESVKSWSVARLREHVLDDGVDGAELLRLSRGLSSEMIAACAKLMTNMDLIYAARKIRVVVHATNTVGLEGRGPVVRLRRRGHRHQPGDRQPRTDGGHPERVGGVHAPVAHPDPELLP